MGMGHVARLPLKSMLEFESFQKKPDLVEFFHCLRVSREVFLDFLLLFSNFLIFGVFITNLNARVRLGT